MAHCPCQCELPDHDVLRALTASFWLTRLRGQHVRSAMFIASPAERCVYMQARAKPLGFHEAYQNLTRIAKMSVRVYGVAVWIAGSLVVW